MGGDKRCAGGCVNAQGIVEPRPVQVGDWSGDEWVITGGLKAGDQVIVDGVVKARPGSPVKIAQAPAAGGQPGQPPQGQPPQGEQPAAKPAAKSEAPQPAK